MYRGKPSIINAIAVTIGGVAATQSLPILKSWITVSVLPEIITTLISISVYYIFRYLFLWFPKRFSLTRKWIDSRSKYEGHYLEIKNVKNSRSYSIICVTYNYPDDNYCISGVSVELEGGISIQWKSTFVKIDDINSEIIYALKGNSTDTSDGIVFEGITYMNFDRTLENKPRMGLGHYIDTLPAKSDFAFHKITASECKKYLGEDKECIRSQNDYKKFVVSYHEENPDKVFSWESEEKIK